MMQITATLDRGGAGDAAAGFGGARAMQQVNWLARAIGIVSPGSLLYFRSESRRGNLDAAWLCGVERVWTASCKPSPSAPSPRPPE
jgi:hypothetical protein